MSVERRKTKEITVGSVKIGADNAVSVQSMTNTKTSDFAATLAQVKALAVAGCDIVRIAVPDAECAGIFDYLKTNGVSVPLVADVHFDYKIAVRCAESGADKIRINPGNIGSSDRVKAVADACRARRIPIRVGVNSGSLQKDILEKFGGVTPRALAESAMRNAQELERFDFDDIVIAVKSSNVLAMIEANEIIADACDYPIHLGVTEAGSPSRGVIKSSIGISSLLLRGIGDTVRVSLTADPLKEVEAARAILEYCGRAEKSMIEVVSCPTCGRTSIDLIATVNDFEEKVKGIELKKPIKVAIMGCAVNGPGEAREADVGLAGGDGKALIFKNGEPAFTVSIEKAVDSLIEEIKALS